MKKLLLVMLIVSSCYGQKIIRASGYAQPPVTQLMTGWGLTNTGTAQVPCLSIDSTQVWKPWKFGAYTLKSDTVFTAMRWMLAAYQPKGNYQTAGSYLVASDSALVRNYDNALYQPKGSYQIAGTYLQPNDSTLIRNYDNALYQAKGNYVTGTPWTAMGYVIGTPWTGMGYLVGSDSAKIRTYDNALYQPKGNYQNAGVYLIPADTLLLRNYDNALYQPKGSYVTGTPWTAMGYLAGSDSTKIRLYDNALYQPKGNYQISIANLADTSKYYERGDSPIFNSITISGSLAVNGSSITAPLYKQGTDTLSTMAYARSLTNAGGSVLLHSMAILQSNFSGYGDILTLPVSAGKKYRVKAIVSTTGGGPIFQFVLPTSSTFYTGYVLSQMSNSLNTTVGSFITSSLGFSVAGWGVSTAEITFSTTNSGNVTLQFNSNYWTVNSGSTMTVEEFN